MQEKESLEEKDLGQEMKTQQYQRKFMLIQPSYWTQGKTLSVDETLIMALGSR